MFILEVDYLLTVTHFELNVDLWVKTAEISKQWDALLTDLKLDSGEPYPVGGPMVLRPFEDLYAAAWRSFMEGDKPRYEAVKRRRK